MPYYSGIILNSFYNRLFPKLFRHNRRMPSSHLTAEHTSTTINKLVTIVTGNVIKNKPRP